jgi:RimJ/RimL family protein N-acetyltransferase
MKIPLMPYAPRPLPSAASIAGRYVTLEAWDGIRHGHALFAATTPSHFDYVPFGPYRDGDDYGEAIEARCAASDWRLYAVCPNGKPALGHIAFIRLRPEHGSMELGCVMFGEGLARTREATEAVYLWLHHGFEALGYRRLEWKCDTLNAASMRSAVRFGFTFEGIFRQEQVMKGRNRDTAWFSLLDHEWPRIKAGYAAWLHPENFDAAGLARSRLQF